VEIGLLQRHARQANYRWEHSHLLNENIDKEAVSNWNRVYKRAIDVVEKLFPFLPFRLNTGTVQVKYNLPLVVGMQMVRIQQLHFRTLPVEEFAKPMRSDMGLSLLTSSDLLLRKVFFSSISFSSIAYKQLAILKNGLR
jgi:hypothetical protein